ncbi:MAG: hypothetical protein QM744_12700 [Mesorhizobium sp.]
MEQRLKILEDKFENLFNEVGNLHDNLETAKANLGQRIDDATSTLRKEAGELLAKLQAKFVDGLGAELLGIAFFLLGTIMGSIPQEIADWLT